MTIANVQQVSKSASEGLHAKFSDLCEHEELRVQGRQSRISKLASKSRQATKSLRRFHLQERKNDEGRSSSVDEEDLMLSILPVRSQTSVVYMRRLKSFKTPKWVAKTPPRPSTYHAPGVADKVLQICGVSCANTSRFINLPAY